MGMNSRRLSERVKQPGHDRTFTASETNFIVAARAVLQGGPYFIQDHPRDLCNLFGGELGVIPEAAIVNTDTGRRFFVEVKKQGPNGNAEERACKHHTVQFYETLREKFGYAYHPFVTVFCENLAIDRRYTLKAPYYFEPGQYFLWVEYDPSSLGVFLKSRCAAWLD